MRMRSYLAGPAAPLALGAALGLSVARAGAPEPDAWLHTALVEGCVASFKPGTTPGDMMKAGFAVGGELDDKIRRRLARGLGGVIWFNLVASNGAVHVGRAAMRQVCVVVQSSGSSAAGVKVATDRLVAAKASKSSTTPGKTLTRELYSMAAGDHTLWISVAHTNDYEPGEQGASAVIVVELKKR